MAVVERAAAKVAAVMTVVERAAVARAAAKVARAATCSVRRNLGSRCRSRTPVVCRRGQTSSPRLHPGTRHCRPVHRCRRTAWVVVLLVAMAEVFARPRREGRRQRGGRGERVVVDCRRFGGHIWINSSAACCCPCFPPRRRFSCRCRCYHCRQCCDCWSDARAGVWRALDKPWTCARA